MKVELLLFMRFYRFDAVIHFAGLKAVGESVEKPLLYYNNNLVGTISLLEVMAQHGCKNVIFSNHMSFGSLCWSLATYYYFVFPACVFIISYCVWFSKGSSLHRGVSNFCIEPIWSNKGGFFCNNQKPTRVFWLINRNCFFFCSYSLRKSAVMCMVLIRIGRSYCLGTSILLVHILVVTLVKILAVFQTISCLMFNKSLLVGDLISLSLEMITIQKMEQGYVCLFS